MENMHRIILTILWHINLYYFLLPQGHKYGSGGIAFREHDTSPQDLAYQGWEYRNKKDGEEIKAGEFKTE